MSAYNNLDAVIPRYAQLDEELKAMRKHARAIREERTKIEEFLQEYMRCAGLTEVSVPNVPVVVRARERTSKRAASKGEIVECLAEQIGVSATDVATAIEAMATETTSVKFSLVGPKEPKRRRKGGALPLP